jgi:hypothetical protein
VRRAILAASGLLTGALLGQLVSLGGCGCTTEDDVAIQAGRYQPVDADAAPAGYTLDVELGPLRAVERYVLEGKTYEVRYRQRVR